MNNPKNNREDSTDHKWRRWSKRTTEEIGRPLSASDTFSGMMDIRSLIGPPANSVYDTGSGVITLSGRLPPAPAVVPPLLLYQQRPKSSDWKIGVAAVVLAGMVVASLALIVFVKSSKQGNTVDTAPSPAAAIVAHSTMPAPEPASPAVAAPVAKRDEAEEPAVAKPKPEAKAKHKAKHKHQSKQKNKKPERPAAEDDGARPQTLSRAQVKAGMGPVAGKVKRCAKGKSGLVVMDVAIGRNGRVARAYATGALAGTETGKCAAKAVRRARFPQFSGPTITVKYPFRL